MSFYCHSTFFVNSGVSWIFTREFFVPALIFFCNTESEMYFCGTVYDKLIGTYVRKEGSEDIQILCLWQLEGAEGLCGLFSLDLCCF